MQNNNKVVGIVLALIVGLVIGYFIGSSKVASVEQGASALRSQDTIYQFSKEENDSINRAIASAIKSSIPQDEQERLAQIVNNNSGSDYIVACSDGEGGWSLYWGSGWAALGTNLSGTSCIVVSSW